jgi:hypothetical protein
MFYRQWERVLSNGFSNVRCIQLEAKMIAVAELFEAQLVDFAAHWFRYIHQCQQIRSVRECVGPRELVVHIDFSENYTEKYAREVQATHFGYREQVVLHQGVAYMNGKSPIAFVTAFDSPKKTAPAIAAHLEVALRALIVLPGDFQKGNLQKMVLLNSFQYIIILNFGNYSLSSSRIAQVASIAIAIRFGWLKNYALG